MCGRRRQTKGVAEAAAAEAARLEYHRHPVGCNVPLAYLVNRRCNRLLTSENPPCPFQINLSLQPSKYSYFVFSKGELRKHHYARMIPIAAFLKLSSCACGSWGLFHGKRQRQLILPLMLLRLIIGQCEREQKPEGGLLL